MSLALRAARLWLRYATLQNLPSGNLVKVISAPLINNNNNNNNHSDCDSSSSPATTTMSPTLLEDMPGAPSIGSHSSRF